jgi:small subunit ribosomal protein S18
MLRNAYLRTAAHATRASTTAVPACASLRNHRVPLAAHTQQQQQQQQQRLFSADVTSDKVETSTTTTVAEKTSDGKAPDDWDFLTSLTSDGADAAVDGTDFGVVPASSSSSSSSSSHPNVHDVDDADEDDLAGILDASNPPVLPLYLLQRVNVDDVRSALPKRPIDPTLFAGTEQAWNNDDDEDDDDDDDDADGDGWTDDGADDDDEGVIDASSSGFLNRDANDPVSAMEKSLTQTGAYRGCRFCSRYHDPAGDDILEYTNVRMLHTMLNERGMITKRGVNRNCAKHQRKVAIAVKRARQAGLLSFTNNFAAHEGYRGGSADEALAAALERLNDGSRGAETAAADGEGDAIDWSAANKLVGDTDLSAAASAAAAGGGEIDVSGGVDRAVTVDEGKWCTLQANECTCANECFCVQVT